MMVEIKTRPIIFNGGMARAILDGRKIQTRRVIKSKLEYAQAAYVPGHSPREVRKGKYPKTESTYLFWLNPKQEFPHPKMMPKSEIATYCPYGQVGDRLWVRETFAERVDIDGKENPEKARHYLMYRADDNDPQDPNNWHTWTKWKPSIHMPRWASRITLEITGVRVEQLRDINEKDAIAEGIEFHKLATKSYNYWKNYHPNFSSGLVRARDSFHTLWDSINAKRDFLWNSNPWVWVIEFEVVE